MIKIENKRTYAFDVDDTLLMWHIPEGYDGPLIKTHLNGFEDVCVPNFHTIKHLKKIKSRGYKIVVWSAAGSDWAEEAIKALHLEQYVDLVISKFDYHVDDKPDAYDKIGKWQYFMLDGTVKTKEEK